MLFDFLFGWLVGSSVRTARNSALPEKVKQERYDAAQARKRERRERPGNQMAKGLGGLALFLLILYGIGAALYKGAGIGGLVGYLAVIGAFIWWIVHNVRKAQTGSRRSDPKSN